MKKEKIIKVLSHLGSEPTAKQDRPGWLIASCPFAHWRHDSGVDNNPSFGVDLESQSHRFHCFSCNAGGKLKELPDQLHLLNGGGKKMSWQKKKEDVAGLDIGRAKELLMAKEKLELEFLPKGEALKSKALKNELEAWPEWWLESFPEVAGFEEARAYLEGRDVHEDQWKTFDLRYDPTRERVCFPIRDWNDNLLGLHGRTVVGATPSYYMYGYKGARNPIVWPGEHMANLNKPVVLVESVFDWVSVHRVYKNTLCSLSAGISVDKIKRVDQFPRVVTLYDNGKGGDTARQRLSKYLRKKPIHRTPPVGLSDPGEMSKEQVIEALEGLMII